VSSAPGPLLERPDFGDLYLGAARGGPPSANGAVPQAGGPVETAGGPVETAEGAAAGGEA
jgi:hypothetical protein